LGDGISLAQLSQHSTAVQWFDPSIFVISKLSGLNTATWGNTPFDVVRAVTIGTWAMFKTFAAGERLHFELRAEGHNVWNHTPFRNINNTIGSSDAGKATSAFDPRTFQLGAKAIF
jgi:hypothetical protein